MCQYLESRTRYIQSYSYYYYEQLEYVVLLVTVTVAARGSVGRCCCYCWHCWCCPSCDTLLVQLMAWPPGTASYRPAASTSRRGGATATWSRHWSSLRTGHRPLQVIELFSIFPENLYDFSRKTYSEPLATIHWRTYWFLSVTTMYRKLPTTGVTKHRTVRTAMKY